MSRYLVDDVVNGRLLHLPLVGLPIIAGQGEAMPVLIVEFREIAPIVVAGPTRLLAEHRVMRD